MKNKKQPKAKTYTKAYVLANPPTWGKNPVALHHALNTHNLPKRFTSGVFKGLAKHYAATNKLYWNNRRYQAIWNRQYRQAMGLASYLDMATLRKETAPTNALLAAPIKAKNTLHPVSREKLAYLHSRVTSAVTRLNKFRAMRRKASTVKTRATTIKKVETAKAVLADALKAFMQYRKQYLGYLRAEKARVKAIPEAKLAA